MDVFLSVAPAWVIAAYVATVTLVLAYMGWKLRRRRYLFSPYTIVIATYAFALLVVAPQQYHDEAWLVLGRSSAAPFFPFLNLSVGVNLVGFFLVIAAFWFVEARPRPVLTPPLIRKPPDISIEALRTVLTIGIAVFAGCLAVVGVIPLFGSRTVFNSYESLRPLYNFANYVILFATSTLVVWSAVNRSRRFALLILLGIICMLFTGGRTSVLSVLELIVLLWAYSRYRGRTLRATLVVIASLVGVGVAGLFLAAFRAGGDFRLSAIIEDALYGNTFSDIRDGAFIASSWDRLFANDTLGGNTYLAGLLSFVPSSVSDFRGTWSWGYFTTEGLFGWTGHYGFRGGWSLEAYMNFGAVGLVLAAVICGWLLGRLEALFYWGYIHEPREDYAAAYVWSWLGYGIFTVLIASSATYNLYSLMAVLGLAWFMTRVQRGLEQRFGRTAGRTPAR